MQKLDFMVGRWRGEAWMVRDTERVQTTMTKTIERTLGGVALLVEGLGEGGVSWSREVPGGRVRNTVKIANGEWHEVGEFPRDGTTLDADHGNEAPAAAVMNKNRLEAFSDPRPAHRTRPGEKTECVVHS